MFFLKDKLKKNKKNIVFVKNFYDDISLKEIKKRGYSIVNFIVFKENNYQTQINKSFKIHSKILNIINKKFKKNSNGRNKKFVNTFIGRWLFSYISNCIYFFNLLKKIKNKYPNAALVQKRGNFFTNDKYFFPETTDRFINYFINEIGRYLNFRIIKLNILNSSKYISPNYETKKKNETTVNLYKCSRKLLSIISILISKIIYQKTIYLHNNTFSTIETIKLILKSKFKFSYLFTVEKKNKAIKEEEYFKNNNFIKFYRKINKKKNLYNFILIYLEKYLPSDYKKLIIENFKKNIVQNKNKNKRDKLITKNLSDPSNLSFKSFHIKNYYNTRLISLQHGGGYGFDKDFFLEKFEREVSDYFISWGWQGKKIIKLPQKLETTNQSRINRIKKEIGKFVLFVPWSLNRPYLSHLKNTDYYVTKSLNPSVKFLNKLSREYKVVVKLPPFKNSWQELNNYNINGDIIIVTEKYKFLDLAKASEFTIHNHFNTTALQTLSIKKPTLIFCDKKFLKCKIETKRDLKKLISSKIFFYSESKLIKHIKSKQFITNKWWNSKIVEENRKKFCQKYINTSANYQEKWLKKLL